MTDYLYVEGGGDSKELHSRCREGFRTLLERCGLGARKRMPRVVACGSRNAAYDAFVTANRTATGAYVALLVDSEEPVTNIDDPWTHLFQRDHWPRPAGARDEQAFLMVTSMETWIACDRAALAQHYGQGLQTSALPSLVDLETRARGRARRGAARNTPRPASVREGRGIVRAPDAPRSANARAVSAELRADADHSGSGTPMMREVIP